MRNNTPSIGESLLTSLFTFLLIDIRLCSEKTSRDTQTLCPVPSIHPACDSSSQLGGVYMRKLAPARVPLWDDFLISYRVYMMTGSFHILLFNGTFHVDKIHVWFKIANITHALLVPVYRQTDFTPKWVVVSRLHDTVARFRTGVKFSPRCENRGELTPG